MSDLQRDVPGEPGTPEGEAGPSEADPEVPSIEGRETDTEAADDAS